jgi:fermentation-respiration switch protein FrsA (DUF1100 family)
MNPAGSRLRPLWVGLTAATVLILGAAIALCEFSVRIPSVFRTAPKTAWVEALSRQHNASWREVEIRAADGVPLRAWWIQPQPGNGGAVVLLHGVADTRNGMLRHAGMLLKGGYAVLIPDARGHGTSGGEIISFGIREAGDVRRWVEWLRSAVSPTNVYGLGVSLGAAILLQTLDSPAGWRAVAAESPFATFEAITYDRVGQLTGLRSGWLRRPLAVLAEPALWYAQVRYGLPLRTVSPVEAVRRAQTPVLLIHGTADSNIYPYHSRILQAANPAYVKLWEAPGSEHVRVILDHPDEYERRVRAWFEAAGN